MTNYVILCVILNISYIAWTFIKSKKINIFLIAAISSSYYILIVPILGLLGNEVLGFSMEAEGWTKLIYSGTVYNAAMFCAQLMERITSNPFLNKNRIKPNLKMALTLWIFLFVFYLTKYIYSGVLIFGEYKFLNILIFMFITLSIIISCSRSAFINIGINLLSLFLLILMGFRAFILMLLSPVVGRLIKGNLLLLIMIFLLLLPTLLLFERSRSYGVSFDIFKFIKSYLELDYLEYQDFLVNQGEASAALYSAHILQSNIKYENFYDPYIFAINKFLFLANSSEPNDVLKNSFNENFETLGFAFIHPVELFLQGGYSMIFIGGLLYGLFYNRLHVLIYQKFDGLYGTYLISFASIYFGYFNYSRGYFFQIASGFFIIVLIIYLFSIRFRLGGRRNK